MKQRGRVSAAALSVISSSGIETIRRPEPPSELTDEQSDEWRAVVSRMPADWFPRETWGLLAQYCRHLVSARRVQQLTAAIEKDQEFDIVAYDRALKMQERESRCIASLATKMRISQQTQYDKSKKRGSITPSKPWE
jgi:chaperone required for assembly of F1-ATPase